MTADLPDSVYDDLADILIDIARQMEDEAAEARPKPTLAEVLASAAKEDK